MNKIISPSLLFFCFTVLVACTTNGKKVKPENAKNITQDSIESIINIENKLQKLDSLVFVFYKDPLGKDSLRYTRFYTQFKTADTTNISFLEKQLEKKAALFSTIKKCRSIGKIWCFYKEDVIQTIYFSYSSDDCRHMYIIKNGLFYYVDIDDIFIEKMNNLKLLAK